jgi:hypothetical protein
MIELGSIVVDMKTAGTAFLTAIGAAAWVGRVHQTAVRNKADIKDMRPKIEEIQKTVATLDERSKLILEAVREQMRRQSR